MNNNITELVFILDRSGSMAGLVSDTIGGFNALIEKQKDVEGKCLVTTVLFDNTAETLHDRIPLEDVPPMTRNEYSVRGCTALLDAIGSTIRHIAQIHKYARPEDIPEHTTFVITTDGLENASRHYNSAEVKRMIEHEKEKYGWEFLFVAANIDAVETAANIGISRDRAVDYMPDSMGTEILYKSVSEAVSVQRSCGRIREDWSAPIAADHRKRRKLL